jgi:hypothetical protein
MIKEENTMNKEDKIKEINSHLNKIKKLISQPDEDENLKNQFQLFGLTGDDLMYIYQNLKLKNIFQTEAERQKHNQVMDTLYENYIKHIKYESS